MLDKIKEINNKFSVAGYEKVLTSYIMAETEKYCDECFLDNIGNVVCHKKGQGEKILVNIPISCDGAFISHITEKGYLKFHTIGKIKAQNLIGAKAKKESGELVGVILTDSDKEEISVEDLYLDTGLGTKENAQKLIEIGDIAEPFCCPYKLGENIYGSKLSKTVGILVGLELIKGVKNSCDLYFAFSVMDNLGFKGAKTAATLINPDICITVSSASTSNKDTEIELGKGVAVRIKDRHIIVNKALRDRVIKSLSDENIPYQLEIVSGDGISNNEIMYLSNGILTSNINCPVKCAGTMNEGVNEKDILNMIKSLKLILV